MRRSRIHHPPAAAVPGGLWQVPGQAGTLDRFSRFAASVVACAPGRYPPQSPIPIPKTLRLAEDRLLGSRDRQGRMSFAVPLWNGAGPILKETLR